MQTITIETDIQSRVDNVWELWTNPIHIVKWNQASPDWECPYAENDVRVGGRFLSRMSAKDGSASFDFTGTYTEVTPRETIAYAMDDGRSATIVFSEVGGISHMVITFEMESENSEEKQREGWQAILNNFQNYVEKKDDHSYGA